MKVAVLGRIDQFESVSWRASIPMSEVESWSHCSELYQDSG
jgi:hypothetical protein